MTASKNGSSIITSKNLSNEKKHRFLLPSRQNVNQNANSLDSEFFFHYLDFLTLQLTIHSLTLYLTYSIVLNTLALLSNFNFFLWDTFIRCRFQGNGVHKSVVLEFSYDRYFPLKKGFYESNKVFVNVQTADQQAVTMSWDILLY